MRAESARPVRGFSLLEVLVALAVLALGMLALVRVAAREAESLAHLRDTTQAGWVASNALAEARLRGALRPGVRDGRETLAGQVYHWRLQVQPSPEPAILRIDVQVFGRDARVPLTTLTGFAEVR